MPNSLGTSTTADDRQADYDLSIDRRLRKLELNSTAIVSLDGRYVRLAGGAVGGAMTGVLTVDSNLQLGRVWPSDLVNYQAIRRADWVSNAYGLMLGAAITLISSNTGGTVYVRGPVNDATHQVAVSATGTAVTGGLSTDTVVASSIATASSFATASTGYLYSATQVNNWFRPYDGSNMHIKCATGNLYEDAAQHIFRSAAGSNYAILDSSGLALTQPLGVSYGGTGGTTAATARTGLGIPGWSVGSSAGALVQYQSPNGYLYTNYINTTANVVSGAPTYLAGQVGGDNFLRWYTQVNASAIAGTITSQVASGSSVTATGLMMAYGGGQVISTHVASNAWNDASISSYAGAYYGVCQNGISFHTGNNAPQWRIQPNTDNIECINSNGSAYGVIVGQIYNTSSRKLKQDIADWPALPQAVGADVSAEFGVPSVMDTIHALRPKFYRWERAGKLYTLPLGRRGEALVRLEKIRAAKGLGPFFSDEMIHDCARDACDGTAEDPCHRIANWEKGHVGFVSEEVGAVFPLGANYDTAKNFSTLDALAMIALLTAGLQELDNRLRLVESK